MVAMDDTFYQPTPDEIAAACAEIRRGWSDNERQARLAKLPPLQDCDFVGVQAAAEVKAEDRLIAMREALASKA